MRFHTSHALLGGLAAVAAMASLTASAQPAVGQSSRAAPPSSQPSSVQLAEESKFLQEAIRGNTAEVKMGELAKERAQSKDVRDYGQMLIDDHSKGNKKATEIARRMNISAPTEESAEQKQERDAMAKLSGSEFDTTFLSHMVQDHQEDIAKYTAQAQNGDSSKITDFANDSLPTLKEHLSKAQSIESKLSHRSSSTERGSSGK